MAYDSPVDPVVCVVWEDTGLVYMARILGQDGAAVTRPTISSIQGGVMDVMTEEEIATLDIEVNDTVFNTLQTEDPRWTEDTVGYNFLFVVPASAFPEPNQEYRVGFRFTPATGEPFGSAVDVTTKRLLGA